jgi:hypothetical protein
MFFNSISGLAGERPWKKWKTKFPPEIELKKTKYYNAEFVVRFLGLENFGVGTKMDLNYIHMPR